MDTTDTDTICYYLILELILEQSLSELESKVDQKDDVDRKRGTNVPQRVNQDNEQHL